MSWCLRLTADDLYFTSESIENHKFRGTTLPSALSRHARRWRRAAHPERAARCVARAARPQRLALPTFPRSVRRALLAARCERHDPNVSIGAAVNIIF
ncbi:hypothetical protein EVAR_82360_1 [Eumeta japonica]|uniref:Uncharacterized protein n=1 Tax=Eumeta variegata TaxID=151549 RepID=A0A4C1U9V7_EUMVA|nr:hypothetical protein EVAR_82360_1 [Eumeta japonica]